jgi:hypothetical protein
MATRKQVEASEAQRQVGSAGRDSEAHDRQPPGEHEA